MGESIWLYSRKQQVQHVQQVQQQVQQVQTQ
jgi:hypothetical protein